MKVYVFFHWGDSETYSEQVAVDSCLSFFVTKYTPILSFVGKNLELNSMYPIKIGEEK